VDDKALLKLLAAGIGEEAAAVQMDTSLNKITQRVREYLDAGILKCNGEHEAINWKVFGEWKKHRATQTEAA
jgi:hypothetical protein